MSKAPVTRGFRRSWPKVLANRMTPRQVRKPCWMAALSHDHLLKGLCIVQSEPPDTRCAQASSQNGSGDWAAYAQVVLRFTVA